jgi:hypothetical protein
MYTEGLVTAATPLWPAGLPGCPLSCKALDYLETMAVPSVLGPLETPAMGQEGAYIISKVSFIVVIPQMQVT